MKKNLSFNSYLIPYTTSKRKSNTDKLKYRTKVRKKFKKYTDIELHTDVLYIKA